MLLTLLLACAEEAAVETGEALAPAPYLVEEEAPPAPVLDEIQLEDALRDALEVAVSLNASPVLAGYGVAMEAAEPGCPDYYTTDGNTYWFDQCSTAEGARFDGYGFHVVYDAYDGGDGNIYDGEAFYGVAQVTDVSGRTFTAGGSVYSLVGVNEGTTTWQSVVQGSFSWDGPEAEGTWLDGELQPDLTMYAVGANANEQGRAIALDGGIGGFTGDVSAVVFDSLLLYTAAWGSTCATEPGGMVSIRDSEGGWTDVLFDGPAEWGATSDPSQCDGCGTAWYRGEPIGSVCVDMTTLLRWDGAPW